MGIEERHPIDSQIVRISPARREKIAARRHGDVVYAAVTSHAGPAHRGMGIERRNGSRLPSFDVDNEKLHENFAS